MPAKDKFHNTVKNALIKKDWKITNDPLKLEYGKRRMYVDMAAEKIFSAEKEGRKIAVEVKSFLSLSELTDVEEAFGHYAIYHRGCQNFCVIENRLQIIFFIVTDHTFSPNFSRDFDSL